MNKKDEKLRDLLGHAANAIDKKYGIEKINVEVSMETELFGKQTFITCEPMEWQELVISVWWGYKVSDVTKCRYISTYRTKNKLADAMVSGYIERKEGLWIQCEGSKHLFDTYCSRSAQQDLYNIPVFKSAKIGRIGTFYV